MSSLSLGKCNGYLFPSSDFTDVKYWLVLEKLKVILVTFREYAEFLGVNDLRSRQNNYKSLESLTIAMTLVGVAES